ncbi:MAG: FAD/NAD(P)-binding oxidoreductase, partial [Alphaproteobacteria bacterium]
MTNTCDLVVIGSGPAGMAAAVAAAEYGLSAILVDEQPAPGGQIYRDVERLRREGRAAAFGPDYASGLTLTERLRESTVDYRPRTSVWQIDRGFTVFVSHGGQSYAIRSKAIILAVGAVERPIPISDWTLPGVMTVGAAQIMLKTSGLVPPQPFWIAGQGPLPLLYAAQLLKAGVRPAGILDTTPAGAVSRALPHVAGALSNWRYLVKGLGLLATIRRAGVPFIRGVTSLSAEGGDRLTTIKYTAGAQENKVNAEALLLHEGVVPNVHMSLALGVEHRWDEALQAPVPKLGPLGGTSLPGVFIAGDAGAIGGARLAEIQGRKAAIGVAHALGQISKIVHDDALASLVSEEASHAAIRPFLNAVYAPRRD